MYICRVLISDLKQFIASTASKTNQYLLVIVIVLCVSVLCYLFSSFIDYRVTAFVLFVTVSIIGTIFDIFPVLLSALLSALIWDFFFIPPSLTFHVNSTEDLIMLLMYFVIASVSAVLTYKIRQITKMASEEEEKARAVKLYDTLLNSLSHELRTPIATIVGATDNMLNDKNRISEQNRKELLHQISQASLRLNRQVENLLNMSRLESGFIQPKKDWCDVQELVHSVVNQLDESLSGRQVTVVFDENLPLVKLDFGLMQQVLNNLISNAALYTPCGSTITICALMLKESGEHLSIRIEDGGKGFPQDEIDKVFNKFYRLKDSRTGGTGLGLSIVKGLVEAHKGSITLKNLSQGGASFQILIPVETSYLNSQEK